MRLFYNDQILGNGAEDGGGLNNISGQVNIADSTLFGGNTATEFGGGIESGGGSVTMSGGTLTINSAGVYGGGLYVNGGSLTLINGVTIGGNNQALGDPFGGNGGGAYLAKNSTTTFDGCTVSGNHAEAQGVGVYEQNGATVTITSLTDQDDPGGKPVQGP